MAPYGAPTVLALWLRRSPGAAPEPQAALRLEAGRGVVGDHTLGRRRHVTLLFEEEWGAACAALGVSVAPSARRANVLLSGQGGLGLIGRRVRLGEVELEIEGETRPCAVMERGAAGLMEALTPDGRAGVWGRVRVGGTVAPGARLTVLD